MNSKFLRILMEITAVGSHELVAEDFQVKQTCLTTTNFLSMCLNYDLMQLRNLNKASKDRFLNTILAVSVFSTKLYPVWSYFKQKKQREIFIKAAMVVTFKLSSESSFYLNFVIESTLNPHPLCM